MFFGDLEFRVFPGLSLKVFGSTAGSTGRCNSSRQSISGCLILQRLAWAGVEPLRDEIELRLRVWGKVGAARQILPQQAIGVLVRASLPRALRIAEVDLHVGGDGEPGMTGQLHAAIPRERRHTARREGPHRRRQRLHDAPGIFAGKPHQLHDAGVPFGQGRDVRVVSAAERVTLPVAGDGAVGGDGGGG